MRISRSSGGQLWNFQCSPSAVGRCSTVSSSKNGDVSFGTTVPERIQLSRRKGWRMPPNTVKVDRSTRWGNPFRVETGCSARMAVRLFQKLLERPELAAHHQLFVFTADRLRADLGGRNLACWCPIDQPCHADVLLEIANRTAKYSGGKNDG